MDEFYYKRLGIVILGIIALFAVPFITWMGTLNLPLEWITFLIGVYGLVGFYCEEVVRHYFKIPKAETVSAESPPG